MIALYDMQILKYLLLFIELLLLFGLSFNDPAIPEWAHKLEPILKDATDIENNGVNFICWKVKAFLYVFEIVHFKLLADIR